jgi:hypothetical protein
MKRSIKTLGELEKALKNTPDLVEELKTEASIVEDLERYLEWLSSEEVTTTVTTELKREKKRSNGIHPSSACKKGVCLLKLYYECTGEIAPHRPYVADSQRIWDIGTLLHDTYQAHLNSMYGDQFADEVHLRCDELHIVSHADGIFDFERLRSVLEMKSIKDGGKFGWAKVQEEPFEDNVRQAHFYMWLEDVPFANILYLAKNHGGIKEHVVSFDFDLWDEIQTEVVEPVISAAYKDGEKVEATAGFMCRWCDFSYACPAVRQERKNVRRTSRPWASRRRS